MKDVAIKMAIAQLREYDKTIQRFKKNEASINVMLLDLVEICEYQKVNVPEHIVNHVNKFKNQLKDGKNNKSTGI
jgi:hypothetical protein